MKPGFDFAPPQQPWSDGFGAFPHPPFFHFFEIPGWMAFVSLLVGTLLYFVPTFVAFRRRHHNRAAIGLLNVLLGWTFFGWAVALIWAATAVRRECEADDSQPRKSPSLPAYGEEAGVTVSPPIAPATSAEKVAQETGTAPRPENEASHRPSD